MHDKLSEHVGNHGGAYTDIEGMRKQFTTIDHDPKTSIGASLIKETKEQLNKELQDYKARTIEKILALPAVYCPEPFLDFTLRGDRDKVEWNETMIKDPGLSIDQLRSLLTLLQNKADLRY